MKKLFTLICILGSCLLSPSAFANITQNTEVQSFISETAKNCPELSTESLTHTFSKAHFNQKVINKMTRPRENPHPKQGLPTWENYRDMFVNPVLLTNGEKFWKKHDKTLRDVEKQYGVPAEIIIATIGIETHFGHKSGEHRVLDSLATLAFQYPTSTGQKDRSAFFRKELREFLLLCKEQKLDPLTVMGSYAGAMGVPQFMPSSYRYYAVKYKGKKPIDLYDNTGDIIASVANYYARNTWKKDASIVTQASINNPNIRPKNYSKNPVRSPEEFEKLGIATKDKKALLEDGWFITLKGREKPQHWLAHHNFDVIRRYNKSPLYAMTVYELSEAFAKQREST